MPNAPLCPVPPNRLAPSERLHELDSLRGLAALGVVFFHYSGSFHQRPLNFLFGPLYGWGWMFVIFFFVLSGFVLSRTYWTGSRRLHLAGNIGERIARLYPLHLFTLLVVLAGELLSVRLLGHQVFNYGSNNLYHFVLNLLLLQASGWEHYFSFNYPAWTISSEFLVNLAFFALILLPGRLPLLLSVVLCLGFHWLPPSWHVDPLVVETVWGFFTGVLLFRLYAFALEKSWWRPSLWADAIAAGTFALLAVLFVNPAIHGAGLVNLIGGKTTLFAVIIASVPLSLGLRRFFCWAPFVYLGEISYSIYMVHFPLQLYCEILFQSRSLPTPYAHPWFLFLFFALVIACASLTYHWIELPGKRWLRSLAAPVRLPHQPVTS